MGKTRARPAARRRQCEEARPPRGRFKTLCDFNSRMRFKELKFSERACIVEQAMVVLENFHINLPRKRAAYAVDPLRQLSLLRQRLSSVDTDRAFHREMTHIFNSLHDQHAMYTVPPPLSKWIAWLPFTVEVCYEANHPVYLVTKVAKDWFAGTAFRKGVEVAAWNGVPIERAVEVAGDQNPLGAGNRASQLALRLLTLTARPFVVLPPPDEEWVIVGYRIPGSRTLHEIRVSWMVSRCQDSSDRISSSAAGFQNIRKLLFASQKKNVLAKPIETKYGTFGYLRIFNFEVSESESGDFVKQVISKIKGLPKDGLIIDIRANPGGRTHASEPLLPVISPDYPRRPVEPQRLYFRNTPLALKLCQILRNGQILGPQGGRPWIESIERGLQTGAEYSAGFPFTDPKACNLKDQFRYLGPVIMVTDALTRSAAEFLAAGFQDHGGMVLGIDLTTAGAGGQVKTHSDFVSYFHKTADSPLKSLPHKAEFRLPFRRSQRVGLRSGAEIEDFGVKRNYEYRMTRTDLLKDNRDLLEHAAGLLASGKLPVQQA